MLFLVAKLMQRCLNMELRSTCGAERGAGGDAKADRKTDFI